MGLLEEILLGLLVTAFVAFPVAVFLYLRTAYRGGGWPEVRAAAIVAACCMLFLAAIPIWCNWEGDRLKHAIEHPFALSTIFWAVLVWQLHSFLNAQTGETNDHN